ncbi:IS1 family transposase [Trichocoleus sp. FACHB-90]|uniref:IS1 family transposase n=1 Tax=Cyanophyceae TaxID=3028117 RepID=UPI001688749E|nr:IS1 family transposase [Trichocoleus sp. FACHB-90]MBD1929796.1 IS1 family transposase [Trichocoleus sp. FACHB-90]
MERLKSENEALRQSTGTQAVIERNAKIQDLEECNQELRVKLTEVRKELVDVKAEKEDIQRRLDAARLKLFNLESETQAASESEISDQEAIAFSTTIPLQVEASDPGEVTDKRHCPKCGKVEGIRNKGIRKNKDGTRKQKWLCTSCNEGWSVAIAPSSL